LSRDERFIKFVGSLWEHHRECFSHSERPWIAKITDKEEKIYAIFVRSLIWNEQREQQLVQKELGKFEGTISSFSELGENDFKVWIKEKIKDLDFAIKENGRPWSGAHRDNRHKLNFPRALFEYMQLVGRSQIRFFDKFSDFDSAFDALKEIHSIGNLTSFDILQRLYRTEEKMDARLFKHHPLRFHLTGSGVARGLRKIYGHVGNNRELEEQGNILIEKIREKHDIPKEVVYYETESILCIYQKDKYLYNLKSEDLLNRVFKPKEFADIYAQTYCKGNQTICCEP